MQQALSQIDGIGQVIIGGASLPAVRVELNPLALFKYGIGLEDVRAALASANAHSPKGTIEEGDQRFQIYTNDQANHAADYRPLVIAYRNGSPVRLTDVAEVNDSVENLRNQGLANGKPAVLVFLYRQPGANIIDTVDRVSAILPQLEASIPSAINVAMTLDRTTTIRTSLHDVERTLIIAIILVVLVVFAFLRNVRATLIPSVAVPVSLIGTFGVDVFVGLQPRQPFADGSDDFDRLCRRRRDRGAGKRHPAHRSRHDQDAGGAARRGRSRLHSAVDEPLADRRLCADPADGRHRRPAVPRVRDDLVGGDHDFAWRFADDDADDVRVSAQ